MTYKNGDRVPGNRGHVYFFDGFRYPSVTTILHAVEEENEGLKRWRETYKHPRFKSAKEYTNYTAMRGTFIHYVVLNQYVPFGLDPSDLPPLPKWAHWQDLMLEDIRKAHEMWETLDIEVTSPINIEEPLCNHEKWYAGTPDLRANINLDGEIGYTLVDIKTSKKPRDSHFVQIGAYSQMIPKTLDRALLIYLNPAGKKPEVEILDIEDIHENMKIFCEMRDDFYNTPNVIEDYGLIVPE